MQTITAMNTEINNKKSKTVEVSVCESIVETDKPVKQSESVVNEELNETEISEDVTDSKVFAAPPSSPTNTPSPPQPFHHIKKILWKDKTVPIVTQNENGPCPLIAITNVLLLREKLKISLNKDIITTAELLEMIGSCILENIPQNICAGAQLNYEQNVSDAMTVLPKLQTGLDVNVKFTGVRDFEYTPECIIFDLLNIVLYHGWLIDPQAEEVVKAVGKCGYNQLVEKIIQNKVSSQPEAVTEALNAEQFLERSASQLTYHGLCELSAAVKEEELAVFFRNNHFSTVHKRKLELFQLVTDLGFLNEPNVVWETLSNIEGDGEFVDGSFVTVPPKPSETETSSVPSFDKLPLGASEDQQIKHDYFIALSLQEDQQKQEKKELEWEEIKAKRYGAAGSLSDEELARRLQEEEDRQAESDQNQESQSSGSVTSVAPPASRSSCHRPEAPPASPRQDKEKKGSCVIL